MKDIQTLALYGALGGLGLAILYFMTRDPADAGRSAGEAVGKAVGGAVVGGVVGLLKGGYDAVPDALHVESDQNIIYKMASVPVAGSTGDKDTLGTWWWEVWNDDPLANDPYVVGTDAYKKRTGASGAW